MNGVAGLALLVLAAPVSAQQAPAPPPPEIVITGRGLPEAPGEAAYSVAEIDRDRLQASASERLEDVLRDVAGLQQFRRSDSRSANPTSQGITLRGLGGNAASRVLLVLDGVPQADPFGGWVAFPAYATDRLGRVRVTRGGGSGLFGPGALAGTIELDSASAAELAPVYGSVAYGSRDAVDARGGVSLVRGPGFGTIAAAYARGDGFAPIVAEDRGPADRAAPYEQASLAARGVVTVAAATELQANVSAFTDRRDRGLAFTDNRSEGADASVRLVGRGPLPFALLGYVQTRAFASRFASVDAARTAASLTLDQYNVPATGLGARVELAPRLGRVQLRLGGDVRALSGETRERFAYVAGAATRLRRAGGETLTAGGFVDASLEAGALTISASARLDRWTITDGRVEERAVAGGAATATAFADRDGWQPTGRGGIAWRIAAPLTLRAAAYRGWRLPTLNELYRPFRVSADATAANAALAPETLEGVEAGLDWMPRAGVRLSATAFANRLEDAIANVTVANGPATFPGVGFVSAAGVYRRRENLEAVRVRGVELDASAAWRALAARASYAFSDARVTGDRLGGLRPAQTPRHQASATMGWARGGAEASATARYVSAQFEDDGNTRALDDAVTLDLRGELPLGRGLALEARAENAFDARVEAGISGADVVERASPRTLWLGLRFRR